MAIYLKYAVWAAAAGALIPVMAILNARLGQTLGAPAHAAVVLFFVALLTATAVGLMTTGQFLSPQKLLSVRPIDLAGGMIVAAYVLSVTWLAPRFGIGNTILFVMVAQIFVSAAIDHFGLFGAAVRPVSLMRAVGLAVLVLGLTISQLAAGHPRG